MTMTETILANARIITDDDDFIGHIRFNEDGIIDLGKGADVPAGAVDCLGDYVSAGLIELHTDNLERHMQPRPGVTWPKKAAALAHDRELAGAGITTVFDALRVGSMSDEKERTHGYSKYAREVGSVILDLVDNKVLKVSHFLHLRAELCTETLADEMEEFGLEDRVGIVSLMDHTPGQRQFRDIKKLREYLKGKHGYSDQGVDEHFATLKHQQAIYGEKNRRFAIEKAGQLGSILASHDDTTESDVASSASDRIIIAEFPTTMEAARKCRDHDQIIMMGAPNIIRGGSHSGNIAAAELADAGLLDVLSSDYIPSSLLMAAVNLGQRWGSIAEGMATVTSRPARATGLDDRGGLTPGKRPDLLRFAVIDGMAVVRGVWTRGIQVA